MDDNASSNDIYVGTGAYFPKVCRQLNTASPILADVDVADVTKMESAFAPHSVCNTGGIPMPACRLSVRGAAVAVFMDMNGVKPRGRVVDFNEKRNLIAGLSKSRCPGHATSARRTNYRDRLLRSWSVGSIE